MAAEAVRSEAVLAAHTPLYRAPLYSNDADFARFPALLWKNPLTEKS